MWDLLVSHLYKYNTTWIACQAQLSCSVSETYSTRPRPACLVRQALAALLVASYELFPLLVGDARLVELALASRELREGVLQQPPVVIPRHLYGGDVEVEGAGDTREGRGACYFHTISIRAIQGTFNVIRCTIQAYPSAQYMTHS